MAYDQELADRVLEAVAERAGISTRKMFGGFAVMLQGNMLAGVMGDDLMVRAGPDAHDRLLPEPDARVMEFTRRPTRGMLIVSGASVGDQARLEQWIGWAEEFVGGLPPK